MKRIVSVTVAIAILLSAVLILINVNAANGNVSVTIANESALITALATAEDGATLQLSDTVELSQSFVWPKSDRAFTISGGTLDLSAKKVLYIASDVTFENVALTLAVGSEFYAQGNSITLGPGVTMSAPLTLYGGQMGGTLDSDTNITVLSGTYSTIYGGSNGGTINGSTNLHVTGNVNAGIDWSDHSGTYNIYGGGNNCVISGDANFTMDGNALANYIFGGSRGSASKIGGYTHLNFGGNAQVMSIYASSNGVNTYNDAMLVMTGGKCQQVFGGSQEAALGSSADPSDVTLRILGGTILRRIYGGCYNNCNVGLSYQWVDDPAYVTGTISLILGVDTNLGLSYTESGLKADTSVFARSRYNSHPESEVSRLIYVGASASEAQSGKVGFLGNTLGGMDMGMGNVTVSDETHILTYTSVDSTITEVCSCGCEHTATASLALSSEVQIYTGKPIECATSYFDADWMSGKRFDLPLTSDSYVNNVDVGMDTASVSGTILQKQLTSTFTIVESSNSQISGDEGEMQVKYTTSEYYEITIPPQVVLGAVDEEISYSLVATKVLIPYANELAVCICSQNSFKVVSDANGEISYKLAYGTENTEIAAGTSDYTEIMTVPWNVPKNSTCALSFTRTQHCNDAGEYTDMLTFMTSLRRSDAVLKVNGADFAVENYDIGDGSELYVADDITDVSMFEAYVDDLKAAGYTYYTGNAIGDNRYATFTTDEKIFNVMYIDAFDEIRITVDSRDEFSLPIRAEDNVYFKMADYTPNLTLVSDSNIIWPGRMGYIYQLDDGSFFVIDGGYSQGTNGTNGELSSTGIPSTGGNSAAPYMMRVFEKYAPDPNNIVISGWLITHMHEDHFGAFIDLGLWSGLERYKNKITIEQLIYSVSSDENTARVSEAQVAWTELFKLAIDGWGTRIQQKVKAHPGQEFNFHNLTCTVYTAEELLHCRDDCDPHSYGYINNTSIVTMVNFMGDDTLFLADSTSTNNPYVLAPVYGEALKADILQVAHHGYGDTAAGSIYGYVDPDIVFWPVYAQHFYGWDIGYTENSNRYNGVKNVAFNEVLFKNGVKHYVHASKNLTIEDFETYEPVEVLDELQVFDRESWMADHDYITNTFLGYH